MRWMLFSANEFPAEFFLLGSEDSGLQSKRMPRSDDSFPDLSDGRLIVALEPNFSIPKALHKAQHFVGHVVDLTFALGWNHSKIASLATCQHQPKSSFVVRCSLWLWVQAILLLRHTEVHRDDGDACVVSFSSSSMWIRSCSMFQSCCAPGLVRSMGQLVQLLLFRSFGSGGFTRV